ncbi:pyridoxal phosphate-dependent aminotransferase [Lysinibacillus odysseyi]|uniref:Aminotransferase n=1 Tax=Lysinibacillus odysseyi 34hs-1 = NBRC 100172 TaxID=1220589 RepID=A0A0A3IF35_9BACI|nr:aminotransferase class I/II-fold pyridoxal phosphate-dependent enzyme [Lysinibacillus odysseyi]KGR82095.1 histidinol phosphate aminotransferase [Lysinibacillus odysseyi 34hs-1 = NBRC 100172]
MPYPAHGANAGELYRLLGVKMPKNIIDLSENVNPAGVPESIQRAWPKLIDAVSHYPDEQAEPFRTDAAKFHKVPQEQIIVGNGAAECLMVLAKYFSGKTVGLLEPAFSEYRRTLLQEKVQVVSILVDNICTYQFSLETVKKHMYSLDALYLCNPNNPTGVLTPKKQIEELLQHGQMTNCAIVVDEAFMDWTDEKESVISLVSQYDNLIVLRSMTKMYALAGIRLGYIISGRAQQFSGFFPHWNVSGIAIQLGCLCLKEEQYVKEARQYSDQARRKLTDFLVDHGCDVSKSAANFILFRLPENYNPDHFFMSLLIKGVVLRHTKNYTGLNGQWFRVAVKQAEQIAIFKREFTEYEQNNSNVPAWRDRVE